jgi:hypothetical protein
MTQKSENNEIELPEIEVSVSKSWIRLIRWTQVNMPFGELTIRIVNAGPTDLISHKAKVRFDKEQSIPTNFEGE